MYYTNIARGISNQKIIETGIWLLQFCTLSIKSLYKRNDEKNRAYSFSGLIKNGSAIIEIGAHTNDSWHVLSETSKRSSALVVFETRPETYRFFCQAKEILRLKNVTIEYLPFSARAAKIPADVLMQRRKIATVIDFETGINREVKEAGTETLDNYCAAHSIVPDFIKINAEGNELKILNGATEVLKKYKPTIFITCEKRHAGRDNILKTFKLLADLNYSGCFILDDMKLPLINFDFNIYQNPLTDFYCKDFIFE